MINIHGHVAILIDADNAQLSYIDQVLKISEYYGRLKICRAFGDWLEPTLSAQCEKVDALKIDRIQVNRVGKNATDHRLLLEAGEILGDTFWGDDVSVFMIISGDGDFASACEYIQSKGRQVIGIGNREQTSEDLRNTCGKFYYLEELDFELRQLEKRHPIPPSEVRAFFNPLFFAYYQLTERNDWVSYSQLGKKLHEITSDYEENFGKYTLTEWLMNFDKDFECHEQRIRRIDPNPENTRFTLLTRAYMQAHRTDGRASLSALGNLLREIDPDYETRFGGKKLSEWFDDYREIYRRDENHVIHRNYWKA